MGYIYKITNKLSANIKNFLEKKKISLKIIFMFYLKKQKINSGTFQQSQFQEKITFTYKESRSQKDDIPSPACKLTKQNLRQYYFTQGT